MELIDMKLIKLIQSNCNDSEIRADFRSMCRSFNEVR